MKEIRLSWWLGILKKPSENVHAVVGWLPDTSQNREMLEDLRSKGDAIHGRRTHWIEERRI